jgi:hypothetical protein
VVDLDIIMELLTWMMSHHVGPPGRLSLSDLTSSLDRYPVLNIINVADVEVVYDFIPATGVRVAENEDAMDA